MSNYTEKIAAQYDSLYASQLKTMYGDFEPIRPLTRLTRYIPSGTILDVGGGEGRNALYLAQNGYDVTVSDISKVGLDKLQSFARTTNVTIQTLVSDVVTDGINDNYDCFVFSYILHHLNTTDAERVVREAKAHTYPGGVHIITTFTDQGELATRNKNAVATRFYPSEATLRDIYADWEILEISSKETTTRARNKVDTRLTNHFATLIAQKPEMS